MATSTIHKASTKNISGYFTWSKLDCGLKIGAVNYPAKEYACTNGPTHGLYYSAIEQIPVPFTFSSMTLVGTAGNMTIVTNLGAIVGQQRINFRLASVAKDNHTPEVDLMFVAY